MMYQDRKYNPPRSTGTNMKNLIIASIFLFISTVHAQTCEHMAYGGELPKTQKSHKVLCKKEFAVGYSTELKSPLFVVQRLDPEKLTAPTVVESASFRLDPALTKTEQPALSDFVNTGYDRGHMAPFEDTNHDQTAALESMMLTNIIPQHSGNNRGIWRVLEDRVRNMSLDGNIFVITGPIFDQPRTPIGDNAIPVPSKLYKIVINAKAKTSTTYLIPNESVSSSLLPTFVSDIATVSRLTGINFLPILDLTETK